MRESVFYCVTTLLKYLNDYLSLFLIDNYQVYRLWLNGLTSNHANIDALLAR